MASSHDDKSKPESVYVWWSDIDQQWRIRKWDMQPFVEGAKYTRETAAPSTVDASDRDYIVTKLEQRVLDKHGGKAEPFTHHGNLTEGDSAMHFEAATCIKELVRKLADRSAIEPPLYEAELTQLIDYHDDHDSMAEAMGFNDSSLYHAQRSSYFSALRDAIKKREADTLAKMLAPTDGGAAK